MLGERYTPKGSETRIDIMEKVGDTSHATRKKNGHIELL